MALELEMTDLARCMGCGPMSAAQANARKPINCKAL